MKANPLVAGLVLLLISVWACPPPVHAAPERDVICDTQGCISLSKFQSGISSRLNGGVVGYVGYVGMSPFDFFDAGLARTTTDPPSLQIFLTQSINVASLSKVLTTIGVLKSLAAHGLTLDTKIEPYLYADWTKGPNIDTITFRDLLTHRSGFRGPPPNGPCGQFTIYSELKNQIALGVTLADKAAASYNNCNFGIFREMLPFMEEWPGVALYPLKTDSERAADSAAFYIYYMNLKVFRVIGIHADCKPPNVDHILSYPFPPGATPGDDFGDFTLKCGAGGWQLSVADMHTLLFNIIRGDELLSSGEKKRMFDDHLGWDNSVRSDCPDPYPCKNGAFENSVKLGADLCRNI